MARACMQPRLLPDGTPDVHYRTACGGQKLRDIMLQGFIDLYGPYVSAVSFALRVAHFVSCQGMMLLCCCRISFCSTAQEAA